MPPRSARKGPLAQRYGTADLAVLDPEEKQRFLGAACADPSSNPALAWELLYRLEPDLYDRLVRAERLHPGILDWLPPRPRCVVEVGAGTGRLTLELAARCQELIVVEPAAALRRILVSRLPVAGPGRFRVVRAFFDGLPVADGWADLVVACSALTPDETHGGDAGLREMERCCAPGGLVVIVWPNHLGWLAARGYEYRWFPGEMAMEFASPAEAVELAEIFYPGAAGEIRRRGKAQVSYDVLGSSAPRDVAYKEKTPEPASGPR